MKFLRKKPRIYKTGLKCDILIKDYGNLLLKENEQITFLTKDKKKEYDVCRTKWGFYATPSINERLKKFNLKTALVKNIHGKFYILIVEKNKIVSFKKYLKKECITLISWLDEDLKSNLKNIIFKKY